MVAALVAAAWGPAHATSIDRVQRLIHPADAARLLQRGLRTDALPMRPDEIAAQSARERAARRFPHVVTAPGLDWSKSGNRRVGWIRPPRGAAAVARAAALELPPPDTLRVAIVRIDFRTDRGGAASTGNGRFETTPDTQSPPIDRPARDLAYFKSHAEALSRYYDVQTYGRVVVRADVWPRDTSHTSSTVHAYSVSDMADFGPWTFGQGIYRAAVDMMHTMLFAADSQSAVLGDTLRWDDYDRIIIIHAGSDLQSDVRQDSKEDIPSFTIGVSGEDAVLPKYATRAIDRASFVPETINQDGYFGAINGVLAHECGHLFFGFFDVYDIDTGSPVCGYWSLMDSGNMVGARVGLKDGTEIYATGLLPPSIDPFHRAWTTDVLPLTPLAWDVLDSLRSSERHPDIRRVDLTADEYLLIENRYLAPADAVQLDQDTTTRVVLGPKSPDRFEYDALLPGGGLLVWHVDGSVIPLESVFPLDTALRVNPDFGLNTNPLRLGLSVVEADGLGDLGDPTSPYFLGARFDPFFAGNYTVLSDTTVPNLIPHIGTRTHIRIDMPDSLGPTMHARASRTWGMPGWPRRAPFPPGGAQLLAVDADGDSALEVCWAGGTLYGADTTGGTHHGADTSGVFALRANGQGLTGADPQFAWLQRRPEPEMAAIATGPIDATTGRTVGPALFAVVSRDAYPDDALGGKVWLLDHNGAVQPGWPAVLPARVTTPPLIAGTYPGARVMVGCADGMIRCLGLDGAVLPQTGPQMRGPVTGRLACLTTTGTGGGTVMLVAGASAEGDVCAFAVPSGPPAAWVRSVGAAGFAPDLLWIPFGGEGPNATPACDADTHGYTLVVRDVDRLYAFCEGGTPLPGWGQALPDTLVAAIGAGDPDGDGYPEVLVQTVRSGIAFVNATGGLSPGWPKRPAGEDLPAGSPALAADVNGDGRSEVVAMSGAGILSALQVNGKQAEGWPLASGAGAVGAPVIADLDGDGFLELVATDNVDRLWGYALGAPAAGRAAAPWPMLGGDAGRTSTLPADRAPVALAPSAGPLVRGTLMAYPNPARRKPVTFAYTLSEPATVDFRVLDTSGHQVASFARSGRQADNLEIWEPGALPAGLYLVQVRFRAPGHEQHEMLQVGLLR